MPWQGRDEFLALLSRGIPPKGPLSSVGHEFPSDRLDKLDEGSSRDIQSPSPARITGTLFTSQDAQA
ncbi:hypothetical protein HYQ45_012152 [Verticillium longisporum]|uniref:Uncharacterized protein n=1 Tax=Verticillium longisporum TaxID=100787 RepID=A0A8I2ZEV7_VERLO|nr:hypothetical protein HYQ45_012152 [Verticillium longisporum]